MHKLAFDTKVRVFRVVGVQFVSLLSALIFASNLSVDLYSAYLLALLQYSLPLVFLPSLYLASSQMRDGTYTLNVGNLISLVAFSVLLLNLVDFFSQYAFADNIVQACTHVFLTYLVSEIILISRKNSGVLLYSAASILFACPPLIGALSVLFIEYESADQLIWIQLFPLFFFTVVMSVALEREGKIGFAWVAPTWHHAFKFKHAFILATYFALTANAAGYLFQYIMRTLFVELSSQNGSNFYNFMLGLLQRIHSVYDSVSERYFHFGNLSTPKFYNSVDLALFASLCAAGIAGWMFLLEDIMILTLAALIFAFQAVTAKHHHFLLGNQQLTVLSVSYCSLAFGLLLLMNAEVASAFLTLVLVALLYGGIFVVLGWASTTSESP